MDDERRSRYGHARMQPSAVFVKSFTSLDDLPDDDKPQVAFVGRSNVGKSSLINHLTGQKDLAKVSAYPGRTSSFVFFEVQKRYYLVDLPGYGYAKRSQEERDAFLAMITEYLQRTRMLRLALVVIDARIGPTDLDERMLGFLQAAKIPFAMVVNKVDKLSRSEVAALESGLAARYPGVKALLTSTEARTDRGPLLRAIEDAVRA